MEALAQKTGKGLLVVYAHIKHASQNPQILARIKAAGYFDPQIPKWVGAEQDKWVPRGGKKGKSPKNKGRTGRRAPDQRENR
jgi:hypothetical protein